MAEDSLSYIPDEEQYDFYDPTATNNNGADGFNPLGDEVVKRDYSSPEIAIDAPDLEEPSFFKKGFDQIKAEQNGGNQQVPNQSSTQGSGGGNTSAPQSNQQSAGSFDNPNPAYNDLEEKEKRKASEQMVEAVLDTYDTLKTLSASLGQFPERKLKKMYDNGELDPNRLITIDEFGNKVTINQYVASFNAQVSQVVEPDPAFRKSVKPAMTRVFMKKGWGMTDEQFLLFAFGKDITLTSVALLGMRRSIKDVITMLQEEQMAKGNPVAPRQAPRQAPVSESYDSDWSGGSQTPPSPTMPPSQPMSPSPAPTPQTPSAPEYVQEADVTDEDMDFIERMESAREELNAQMIAEQALEQIDADTEKFNVTFDDNPLRTAPPAEYPQPKVEETFIKGGEIKDDLSIEHNG